MKRKPTPLEQQEMFDRDAKLQAMIVEKERARHELSKMFAQDAKPLVTALTEAGWPPNVRQCGNERSVWDLVNTSESYPHLLNMLADHLTRSYHNRTKEGIARALAVREARGTHIPRVLLQELKKETAPRDGSNMYRWVLINTLVLIGDMSMTEEVGTLLADPRYAPVRTDLQRLAKALCRPSHQRTNRSRKNKR